MSQSPVTSEPSTAVEWPQVGNAMRAEAIAADDQWLHMQTDVVSLGISMHWFGWSEGCMVCHGRDMHVCPRWTHAQSIALTWLMGKAGLV
jgi:hypothetical protein